MNKLFATLLSLTLTCTIVLAQTGPTPQQPQQAQPPAEQAEDIVRITTELVQVDVSGASHVEVGATASVWKSQPMRWATGTPSIQLRC